MELESAAAELYGLDPAGFTAARDAMAARVRQEGDRALAKRIAALRRPTVAAWAANLLARRRPAEAERLVELGRALGEAQRTLAGEELRELSHQRHVLVTALARDAVALAAEEGRPVSEPGLREIEQTLHAALADPAVAREWLAARLARTPPPPTGFGIEPDPTAVRAHRPSPPTAARSPRPPEPAPAPPAEPKPDAVRAHHPPKPVPAAAPDPAPARSRRPSATRRADPEPATEREPAVAGARRPAEPASEPEPESEVPAPDPAHLRALEEAREAADTATREAERGQEQLRTAEEELRRARAALREREEQLAEAEHHLTEARTTADRAATHHREAARAARTAQKEADRTLRTLARLEARPLP
ncbi:hypothetical protein [Streptomyces sp. NPDC086023]|uniref:hypothetical protein n=1 Tax=Streptomyces sp. NPDC086023 TaxID=3365746 RepID=UPI0037CEB731